jgi:hypothetical protein
MKLNFITFSCFLFLMLPGFNVHAQKSKAAPIAQTSKKYPDSFTITRSEFDHLFSKKTKETIVSKVNKYLDKSSVLMNTVNGDTKFLKIRLAYFQNAFLVSQVNGEYSTQVFILSDDKSVFYKGRLDKDFVVMTKCNEDDIVSE